MDKSSLVEDKNDNVKYFESLVAAERQAFLELLESKLGQSENPYSHLKVVADTVSESYANLSARVKIVEEVLLGKESLAKPAKPVITEAAKPENNLRPNDKVVIDASQVVENDNFYGLEYNKNEVCYRWTGPDRTNQFEIPVTRNETKKLRLRYVGVVKPGMFGAVTLDIDGEVVEHTVIHEKDYIIVEAPLVASDSERPTQVRVSFAETFSPEELGKSNDARKLGAAFHAIEVV
jgi:hypothetical protein